MAIGVSSFPIVDNNLADALLGGFAKGQTLHKNYLANELAKIQNTQEQTKTRYLEPKLQEELQKSIYENQIQRPMAENADQFASAKLAHLKAQAQRQQALANLPFGGQNLPGLAGQLLAIESLGKMFGYDSPQYLNSKKAFDLQQSAINSRIGYQDALTSTLPTRTLTNTGKEIVEQTNVASGNSPTGKPFLNQPIKNTNDLTGVYDLKIQKDSTDSQARQRNLYATNIEKTLEQINPDDLVQFSGAGAGLSKLGNKLSAPFGMESKDYDKYVAASNLAKLLASQVRQFYGESIQPSVEEKLNKLTNPSSFSSNKKLSKEVFNSLKNILGQELKTYRDSLKSTRVYTGEKDNSSPKATLRYNQATGEFEEIK